MNAGNFVGTAGTSNFEAQVAQVVAFGTTYGHMSCYVAGTHPDVSFTLRVNG